MQGGAWEFDVTRFKKIAMGGLPRQDPNLHAKTQKLHESDVMQHFDVQESGTPITIYARIHDSLLNLHTPLAQT
jgi:hypothetical protein